MRKLVIYIDGMKRETVSLDFEFTSLVHDREVIHNAIEGLKIKYRYEIAGSEWYIVMACKSRMDQELILA